MEAGLPASIKQFLVIGFEPSDHHLHGLMARFVSADNEPAWLKGPYVQMGLPFRQGKRGHNFFSGFATEFPGCSHQERAWSRLQSGVGAHPANTLVATGTGSGKTECFVYPVLDHAAVRAGRWSTPGLARRWPPRGRQG